MEAIKELYTNNDLLLKEQGQTSGTFYEPTTLNYWELFHYINKMILFNGIITLKTTQSFYKRSSVVKIRNKIISYDYLGVFLLIMILYAIQILLLYNVFLYFQDVATPLPIHLEYSSKPPLPNFIIIQYALLGK